MSQVTIGQALPEYFGKLANMVQVQVGDVAAAAGVSPATVSNALNHPDKVSPATRQRVRDAIDKLGYVRNDAGMRLRQGINRGVGMVVLDVANPFFTDVSRGVEDCLADQSRPLLLANSAQSAEREAFYLSFFEEQRLSGLLITPVHPDLERLRRIRDRGTTVVLVDRMSEVPDFSSVAVDDALGGRLAAEHLLSTGRRSLIFIGGPRNIAQVHTRWTAARGVVEAAGHASIEFVETATMNAEAGRRALLDVIERTLDRRPDAVFAANDLVAMGVLQGALSAGLRVPEDLAIVGYDNIDLAASAAIPLTSVNQPARQMGVSAAEMLVAEMDAPSDEPRRLVFEPELVVRASTVSVP